jgi:Ca-activated chloride channel homolog
LKKFLFILFLGTNSFAFGQSELTRILFILDASNSMNAKWGQQTRIDAAKDLLVQTVDSLKDVPNLELALRVYGHQSPITATYQDCNDTKLEVPFSAGNNDKIKSRIRSIEAKGTTPIARSLEAAAGDFPSSKSRNIIILITDGLEACDNDPCVIAKKLKEKEVKVTPFVIGLGMDLSYLDKFNCIGTYADAETAESFETVLKNVIQKALLNTTAQVNLNDLAKNPRETDVSFFMYEAGSKKLKYAFEHTFNRFGNPDTLILDPSIKYDLVVNTIPPVEVKNVSIKKNTHTIIPVDVPQGFINIRFSDATKPYFVEARVLQNGKTATLNVQKINSVEKYLIGKYDIEVLTLPRIYKSIDVAQYSTTTLDIPAPGFFMYQTANAVVGQIFTRTSNNELEWVCNINSVQKNEMIQLQPGAYKIIYRSKNSKSTLTTKEVDFRINGNKKTSITI